ncbi:MAG TPA: PorV/PorQ family protein [bacterium]|nr:PorV/PorQ family protein [bacterium]
MRAPCLLLFLCLLPAVLFCEEGTSGDDFLSTRPSARASALGGAFVSLGNDLSALSYNPAALVKLTGPSLDFLQFSQVAGVSLEDIAYAQPLSFGTPGLAIIYQGQPAIDNPQATDSPIVAWNLAITAAYAFKLSYFGFSLPTFLQGADGGVAVKYIQAHLGEYDAYDGAVDLGVHVPLDEGVLLGVSLLNLGPPVTFISVPDPLPAEALLGLSRSFAPLWYNQFNVSVDLEVPFQDNSIEHFGVEDWINQSIALRLGYEIDSAQSLNGWTLGLGIQLVQEGLTFHLDYALLPFYYQGFNSFEAQQQFELGLIF